MENGTDILLNKNLHKVKLAWTQDEFNNFLIDLWEHEQKIKNHKPIETSGLAKSVTITLTHKNHAGR
jgi:hypothetical protein